MGEVGEEFSKNRSCDDFHELYENASPISPISPKISLGKLGTRNVSILHLKCTCCVCLIVIVRLELTHSADNEFIVEIVQL